MPVVDAPPDLAALIDAFRAAPDLAARIAAHYALLRWKGWGPSNRTTYTQGATRITRVWGSLKMDEGASPKGRR